MNLLPSGTAKCRHKCCTAPVSTELGLSAQTATQKSQTPTLVLAPWRAILRKLQSCEIVWSFGFIKPCCPVLAQNQPHGEADLEFWVKNTRWAGLSTLCGFTETYIVLWSSYCHTAKVKDLESRLLYRKGETKHTHPVMFWPSQSMKTVPPEDNTKCKRTTSTTPRSQSIGNLFADERNKLLDPYLANRFAQVKGAGNELFSCKIICPYVSTAI